MKKSLDNGTIVFKFTDLPDYRFNPADASEENRANAAVHGWLARLGDSAAIPKDASNGFTVTEAMRRASVVELGDHYKSGSTDWNLKQSARKAPQNAAILALATAKNLTYEGAEMWLQEQILKGITSL